MMTGKLVGRGHHFFRILDSGSNKDFKKILTDSGGVVETSKYLCDSIYELPQRAVAKMFRKTNKKIC